MSDILQNQSFLIWTKGPAALDAMKKALCGYIRSVWLHFLDKLDPEDKEHLQQFIEDLNNNLIQADKRRKEWMFYCPHVRCQTLLDKLTAIRHNQRSLNIVWNTGCKTSKKKEYYWHVANTFMLYGNERNEVPNTCPEDTDIALVLKMMKNCKLFEIDEHELYDKVIEIRNRLFHTGQYNMTDDEMGKYIDKMSELLMQIVSQYFGRERREIVAGIQELADIKGRNLVSISLRSDWKSFAAKALELQKEAIEFDIQFRGTRDTTALQNILKQNRDKYLKCTNSPEWKKKTEENRRSEKRIEEEIERLKRKIDTLEVRLQRETEKANKLDDQNKKLKEEIKDLTERVENHKKKLEKHNFAGEMSEFYADAMNDFGPVGRAAGAVVGGATGTVVEGGKKLFDWLF